MRILTRKGSPRGKPTAAGRRREREEALSDNRTRSRRTLGRSRPVNPFALQDHQAALDAIRRQRFRLDGPSPSVRLTVAVTELFAMVVIWGSLLYLHDVVQPPADPPHKALLGSWEALDDSGLQIQFHEDQVCVLRWDLGEASLGYLGQYVRIDDEVLVCGLKLLGCNDCVAERHCYRCWVSVADKRLRISGPDDRIDLPLKVRGHEFPPPTGQSVEFKRVP
jgi:hypothetical protein